MKNLITDRLLLRKLNFSDVNDIVELDYAKETTQFASLNFGAHRIQSKSDLKKQIKSMVRDSNSKEIKWVIESKQDRKFIGLLAIGNVPSVSPFSISYKIKAAYWNKGIATEAISRVLRFVFDEMNVSSVAAAVHIDNTPSQRVLEKTGFQKTGFLYGGVNLTDGNVNINNQKILSISNVVQDERMSSGTYLIYKSFYPGLV